MEDFEREIARRADAALEAHDREHGALDRSRQQAGASLKHVLRRFIQAQLYSDIRLRLQSLNRPGTDEVVGYALVWDACPPLRELIIRADEAGGEIQWELAAPELGRARTGRVDALDFRPEFLDALIYALFEQESWQRSEVPSLDPGVERRGVDSGPTSSR